VASSKFSVTITGSNVGAMAVGAGSRAEGHVGPKPEAAGAYRFELKAEGATREQIEMWLRDAAHAVAEGEPSSFARTSSKNGASVAWTLTPAEPTPPAPQ